LIFNLQEGYVKAVARVVPLITAEKGKYYTYILKFLER